MHCTIIRNDNAMVLLTTIVIVTSCTKRSAILMTMANEDDCYRANDYGPNVPVVCFVFSCSLFRDNGDDDEEDIYNPVPPPPTLLVTVIEHALEIICS